MTTSRPRLAVKEEFCVKWGKKAKTFRDDSKIFHQISYYTFASLKVESLVAETVL